MGGQASSETRERAPSVSAHMRIAVVLGGLGFLCAFAGWVLLIVAFFWGDRHWFNLSSQETDIAARALGLFMLLSGSTWAQVALRWGSLKDRARGLAALPDSTSPDLLVLRAFADDGRREPIGELFPFVNGPSIPLEEDLISWFEIRGLICVALGADDSDRHALVARRMHVSDEEWQQRVTQLLGRSKRVLVIVGTGPGLAWELRLLRQTGRFHLAMFVVPPGSRTDIEARWRAVTPLLSDGDFVATIRKPALTWLQLLRGRTTTEPRRLIGPDALAAARVRGLTFDGQDFVAWADSPHTNLIRQMIAALDQANQREDRSGAPSDLPARSQPS